MQALPSELLSHIFSFLISSPLHICRLSQTNKHFYNYISYDDILWDYIVKSSPLNYWWECDQYNEENKSAKRKFSEVSKMLYMRENTMKTMKWVKQSQIHEINTLMLGNIGSDLFRLWLALGYYNDKPELDEKEIKEWKLNGARLTFRGESGLDHGEFKAPIPANVVLVHFYDSNSLYFAISKIRKAKDYYPTAPFIVVGDGEKCSKELIEQLCKRADAKAFFSISDYSHPHPQDKVLFHQIYSTLIRYGVSHAIKNTPLSSSFVERKNAIAKRAKKDGDTAEVHSEIRCDGCKVFPIIGPRHKCTRCKRVDLCDKCFSDRENKMNRCIKHEFKRVKKVDFSALDDSEFQ